MPIHEDFIPSIAPSNTQFIILGTMGSINARTIDGIAPEQEYFYYNDSRNHFWKVLQYSLGLEAQNLSIKQKKALLRQHGIAMTNIVQKAYVSQRDKFDPSDTVLFKAYKDNKLEFKKISHAMKKQFKTKPIFFTSREKKPLKELLLGFLAYNQLDPALYKNIHFLKSPTRCNPYQRSLEWKEEIFFS